MFTEFSLLSCITRRRVLPCRSRYAYGPSKLIKIVLNWLLACGSMVCPASTSSSPSPSNNVGVGVPVRPTSNDGATITSTDSDSAPSTETGSTCPTGFYQCSAYYRGNCCRVGRDCATSSCPPSDSTSVLVSNGITVVVATAAASGAASSGGAAPVANNAQKGSCAQGWFSCASSAGGGCCPNGVCNSLDLLSCYVMLMKYSTSAVRVAQRRHPGLEAWLKSPLAVQHLGRRQRGHS